MRCGSTRHSPIPIRDDDIYRAGDVIGGGFAWTRPIRIGAPRCNAISVCVQTSYVCRAGGARQRSRAVGRRRLHQ